MPDPVTPVAPAAAPVAVDPSSPIPEALQPYMPWIIEMVQGLVLALVILFIGRLVAGWAQKLAIKMMEKNGVDVAVTRFLGGMARYTVLAAAVVAALGAIGIETASVIAILGTAGLAIGLALQGNLSHFASGVMILFFRPFTIGDVITAAGHTGGVQEIGLFATTLHTPDNQKIIIPNGAITGGSIVNLTILGKRRATISVGVEYGADVAKVMEVLKKAATGAELVLSDPEPPAVAFVGLGASSIDFAVHCWANADAPSFLGMQHNVRTAIYNALNEAGIEIPFNQIVVHNAS